MNTLSDSNLRALALAQVIYIEQKIRGTQPEATEGHEISVIPIVVVQ